MTSQQKWGEIAVALALGAIGFGFALLAWKLPASAEAGTPGPGSAPFFLGLALLGCAAVVAGRAAIQPAVHDHSTETTSENSQKPLIGLALLVACALALEPLGFILSTFLFLSAGFMILGGTNWRVAIPAAAVGATGLWLFFTKLLGVGLPYGLIEQILFR